MPLSQIALHHIRSYELFSAKLDPKVTLIMGDNGSGKTTLLEALYFLHRGTSFRGRDRDLISYDQTAGELRLDLADGSERRARLELRGDKTAKEFVTSGKKSLRMPIKERLPVVLFEPDELRLLTSSPQRRRQFLDDLLSRLYPAYAVTLSRYARVLMQRNELLKQHQANPKLDWEGQLFAWDVKFTELAHQLASARHDFIGLSNQHLGRLYSGMAGSDHTVDASYSSPFESDGYQQRLLSRLHASRGQDLLQGFTSHGPHRDDFSIQLDGHPASETASRGEMRTIMLAYKLLEVELQHSLSDAPPLILMDDVFSELDITREKRLMKSLSSYQTVITATDLRNELKINASVISL